MANIFLPKDGFNNIERISHIVLTRTGLYIIDSQLLKGHVYNGIEVAVNLKIYHQWNKYLIH